MQMLQVATSYIKVAVREDRTTMCAEPQKARFPNLATQLGDF